MEAHEYANLFPMLPDAEFDEFAKSFKGSGLKYSIITFDGKILDGRNRYKACIQEGVEPRFEEYTGDDPLGEVARLNISRRHLTPSQLSGIAAEFAVIKAAGRWDAANNLELPSGSASSLGGDVDGKTRVQAAAAMGVSLRSVDRGLAVKNKGADGLLAMVKDGLISVTEAADFSKLPVSRQESVMLNGIGAIKEKVKEIREHGAEIADSIKSAMIKGVEEWEGEPEEEPPFDPHSADYSREREEAKNAPLPKWVPDEADRLWSLAKIDLDKILKIDKGRERVLREVILYAETRLKNKK